MFSAEKYKAELLAKYSNITALLPLKKTKIHTYLLQTNPALAWGTVTCFHLPLTTDAEFVGLSAIL